MLRINYKRVTGLSDMDSLLQARSAEGCGFVAGILPVDDARLDYLAEKRLAALR